MRLRYTNVVFDQERLEYSVKWAKSGPEDWSIQDEAY